MRAPDFWRRNGLLSSVLSPVGLIWSWRTRSRIANASPVKIEIPVVCIGNVVTGGAGKTPVALAVADRLIKAGNAPAFLSRGYGGKSRNPVQVDPERHSARDVGDEPLLLARRAPTWVGRDRAQTALATVRAGIDALIMDDGLQNPGLQKDLSILVVDGQYGFGNGCIMPAGPLRESLEDVFKRIQAIVVIGTMTGALRASLPDGVPVLTARFVPTSVDDDISGKRVVAFAGIGRPDKFFETLAGMGCDLVETKSFPDHHYFSVDEVMRLIEMAAATDGIVVTTEKDLVRVPEDAREMVRSLKVALDWDDTGALDDVLSPITRKKA